MPKVSQAHRQQRREQILRGARTCFKRRGFQATSMQELFAEAGLSSGAFYLHFSSKEELVVAIAEDNMREVLALVRATPDQAEPGCLGDVLAAAVTTISERHAVEGLGYLAVQTWAEAITNPVVAESLRALLGELSTNLAELVDATDAGADTADSNRAVASVLAAVLGGVILQLAVTSAGSLNGIGAALRALFPQQLRRAAE